MESELAYFGSFNTTVFRQGLATSISPALAMVVLRGSASTFMTSKKGMMLSMSYGMFLCLLNSKSSLIVSFQWDSGVYKQQRQQQFHRKRTGLALASRVIQLNHASATRCPTTSTSSALWMSSKHEDSSHGRALQVIEEHPASVSSYVDSSEGATKPVDEDVWIVESLQTLSSDWMGYMSNVDLDNNCPADTDADQQEKAVEESQSYTYSRQVSSAEPKSSRKGGSAQHRSSSLLSSTAAVNLVKPQQQPDMATPVRKKSVISTLSKALRHRLERFWSTLPIPVQTTCYLVLVSLVWVVLRQSALAAFRFLMAQYCDAIVIGERHGATTYRLIYGLYLK